MVWMIAGLIVLAMTWLLMRPLTSDDRDFAPSASNDVLFYHSQIAEIERQLGAGLIASYEAAAAKAEAARRLMAASGVALERIAVPSKASLLRKRIVVVTLLILVPSVSLSVYGLLGSPDAPNLALASRPRPSLPDPREAQLRGFIEQIEARLAIAPQDTRGLELIAPLYLRVGRAPDAVMALRRLIEQSGSTPERQTDLGEALVAANGGNVTPEASSAFERALAEKPSLQKAQFYIARGLAQSGDIENARSRLSALLSALPEGAATQKLVQAELAGLNRMEKGVDGIFGIERGSNTDQGKPVGKIQ